MVSDLAGKKRCTVALAVLGWGFVKLSIFLSLGLGVWGSLTVLGQAEGPIKGTEDGRILTGGVEWVLGYFNEQWQSASHQQALSVRSTSSGSTQKWEGPYHPPGSIWESIHQLEKEGPFEATLHWTLKSAQPASVKVVAWEGRLPAAVYAGTSLQVGQDAVLLPAKPRSGEETVVMKQVKQVVIPVDGGTMHLKGSFQIQVVDRRVHNQTFFLVRVYFSPPRGEMSETSLDVKIRFHAYQSIPLDLSGLTNRTLADEVADDGQGGWTDQGPENDLREFSGGELSYNGIQFSVPESGLAALVLAGDKKRSPISETTLELAGQEMKAGMIYLLHGAAWLTKGKAARMIVEYTQGDPESIDLEANRDIGNWWGPGASENAALVWTGQSREARVGLHLSRFPLDASRTLKSIQFEVLGANVWMIVGVAVSREPIPLPRPKSFFMRPGPDWQPIQDSLVIEENSILDWSHWNPDEPAGSRGPLRTNEASEFFYETAPKNRVKVFGASLNFSANFPDKEQADFLARRFRQMGYNSVRFHHYDVILAGGWNARSYVIDEAMKDRLDYFFHRCKKEGLTIATELFTIRQITHPEVRVIAQGSYQKFKLLVPVFEPAMEEWKRFTRDVLARKNPYTGMTMAEDPALVAVVPVNEDTIWVGLKKDPVIRKMYQKKFEGWLKENGRSPGNEEARVEAFNEFVAEVHLRADEEMKRFLIDELGYQGLVSGNNWQTYAAQTPIRAAYDYVDNHGYWDHPTFSGRSFQYPFNHSLRSATKALAEIPRRLFLTRIQDRPFAVTEFNYSWPNPFRSEGGALMGAYSARQDWDLLYRFSWAHELEDAVQPTSSTVMDLANDPIQRLSERFIGVLWFRGDMSSFDEEATFTVTRDRAFKGAAMFQAPENLPSPATYLGLLKRIGTRYLADGAGDNSEFFNHEVQDAYVSEDGGCITHIEKSGDFYARTPRSRAIVLQCRSLDESFVSEFTGGPATLLAAAMDERELENSRRVLVLHLTDSLSMETEFSDSSRASVVARGELPHLVRRGAATLHLPHGKKISDIQVYAVGLDGKRLGEIPFTVQAGTLTFEVNTIPGDGPTRMVYEVVRK